MTLYVVVARGVAMTPPTGIATSTPQSALALVQAKAGSALRYAHATLGAGGLGLACLCAIATRKVSEALPALAIGGAGAGGTNLGSVSGALLGAAREEAQEQKSTKQEGAHCLGLFGWSSGLVWVLPDKERNKHKGFRFAISRKAGKTSCDFGISNRSCDPETSTKLCHSNIEHPTPSLPTRWINLSVVRHHDHQRARGDELCLSDVCHPHSVSTLI